MLCLIDTAIAAYGFTLIEDFETTLNLTVEQGLTDPINSTQHVHQGSGSVNTNTTLTTSTWHGDVKEFDSSGAQYMLVNIYSEDDAYNVKACLAAEDLNGYFQCTYSGNVAVSTGANVINWSMPNYGVVSTTRWEMVFSTSGTKRMFFDNMKVYYSGGLCSYCTSDANCEQGRTCASNHCENLTEGIMHKSSQFNTDFTEGYKAQDCSAADYAFMEDLNLKLFFNFSVPNGYTGENISYRIGSSGSDPSLFDVYCGLNGVWTLIENDASGQDTSPDYTDHSTDLTASCDLQKVQLRFDDVSTGPGAAATFYDVYLGISQNATVDSCTPSVSGNWTIINGDACTLNVSDSITGNFTIFNGSLQIQENGSLQVLGGYVFIWPGMNLTFLPGGNLTG